MATKPGSKPKNEFVFFDVVYEDGSQRSNRRVPAELLGGLEKDEPARGFIIKQQGRSPRNRDAPRWRSKASAAPARRLERRPGKRPASFRSVP